VGDPVRLSRRVVELRGCSRSEAEQFIEGGYVRVDGEVVDRPQFMVSDQRVEIDPLAETGALAPATMVWHQPAGYVARPGDDLAAAALVPEARSAIDDTGIRALRRHRTKLALPMPLHAAASGLAVFTQDAGVVRKLGDGANRIEEEYVVEVAGSLAEHGFSRLRQGVVLDRRTMPSIKASWQSEARLRIACKGVPADRIGAACAAVGLAAVSIKRIRIGRVPLAKLPVGEWRYLAPTEKF